MPHRPSHLSATALLTVLLLLALSAPAWAQGGDEPVRSDDPSAEQGEEGAGEASGAGTGASDARNGRNDVNCEDFDFREDAQAFYERQGGRAGGDEDKLDEDPGPDDGEACEHLPSRGGESPGGGGDFDGDTPAGGIDSGYGPMAPASEAGPPLPLIGGGLGVLALVGLGVARTRRRAG